MKTFLGDPLVEQMCMDRVEGHSMADEIEKGTYWEKGKGCAIGCAVHSSVEPHRKIQDQFGIPIALAYLADTIFERLENGVSKKWPLRFYGAARPAGKDLTMVWPKFAHWLLVDPKGGVIKFAGKNKKVRAAIEGVAALYSRWIETGKKPTVEKFQKVRAAGAAAAEAEAAWAEAAAEAAEAETAAAWAAVAAEAETAAWAVVAAAEAAAAWAEAAWAEAAAGAEAAEAETARKAAWTRMADKLIELMKAA